MGIKNVKFRGRHVSKRAIFFLTTGSLALGFLIVVPFVLALGKIELPWVGYAGVFAAVVSLCGLIICARATSERDVYTSHPVAGVVVNGLTLLLYIIVYLLGMV